MKATYHCKQCRGRSVSFNAIAVWCCETQDMVLEYVDDHVATCRDCDNEVVVVLRTQDGLPLCEEDLFENEVLS
jgi:ribosomal protein L37AE/L43A